MKVKNLKHVYIVRNYDKFWLFLDFFHSLTLFIKKKGIYNKIFFCLKYINKMEKISPLPPKKIIDSMYVCI
jgi:hypothetical protein